MVDDDIQQKFPLWKVSNIMQKINYMILCFSGNSHSKKKKKEPLSNNYKFIGQKNAYRWSVNMVRYVAFLLSSTSLNLKKSRKEARIFIAGKQIPFLGMSMARPDMIKESTRNHENFHNVVNRGCVVSYWVPVSTSSILILFVYFFFVLWSRVIWIRVCLCCV